MASNVTNTVVTSRKLPILPFNAVESRLSIGKAWDEWLEEIERQFRFFRINIPSDKKDALLTGWVVTWFLLGYTVRKNGGLLSTPMF